MLAAVFLACALGGCNQPEHEAGRRVYNFRCYFCHGYSGDAATLAARFLEPAPRDFTRAAGLDERRAAAAIRDGIPGTAMAPFGGTLSPREIELVARFVVAEFVAAQAPNTRYHTAANGWAGHERYAAAFPFATGAIPLDRPAEALSGAERAGRRLFMNACISCHDRSHVLNVGPAWAARSPLFRELSPRDLARRALRGQSEAPHDLRPARGCAGRSACARRRAQLGFVETSRSGAEVTVKRRLR